MHAHFQNFIGTPSGRATQPAATFTSALRNRPLPEAGSAVQGFMDLVAAERRLRLHRRPAAVRSVARVLW